MKDKAAVSRRSDTGTLLAFAVLTPVVYLGLDRYLRHVLPVTCHVLKENRCVLQYRTDWLKNASREGIKQALDYLFQITDPESMGDDHEG